MSSRNITDGFVRSTPQPSKLGGPTARVHPLVQEAMELQEVVAVSGTEHDAAGEESKAGVPGPGAGGEAEPNSEAGTAAATGGGQVVAQHSLERAETQQFDSTKASSPRGMPGSAATSPTLKGEFGRKVSLTRTRSSSVESAPVSPNSLTGLTAHRTWDNNGKTVKFDKARTSSMSLARKKSLLNMKKKLARTRTRDRTIDDRVDQIEQKLAKYMYQTMGLKEAFAYYNKDGNAGLDRAELAEILVKCNAEYHSEEFEALMARYDADGNGTITLSEFTTTVPISRPRLLEYLIIKDEQRAACLGLPLTVLFFIWFVVLLSLHDGTGSAYAVETGVMGDMIERQSAMYKDTFYTVDTVDKLWDWLSTVLVPLAFVQDVPGSDRTVPPYAWGTINSYNHLLGAGVSIQQTRSGTDSCIVTTVEAALNASCHPWKAPFLPSDSQEWSSNASFGLPLCSVLESAAGCVLGLNCTEFDSNDCFDDSGLSAYVAATASAFEVVPEGGRSIPPFPDVTPTLPVFETLLDASQTQAELLAQLAYLRDREWVDTSTKHVQLLFATYNGEYGVYMAVNLMWEINRGGEVIATVKLQDSVPADPYFNNNAWIWFVDIGWIIMVLAQGAGEIGEMRERGFYYWRDFWNVMDWLQIILTLALMVVWFHICFAGLYPLSDLWVQTYNSSDVYMRQEPTSMLLLVLQEARDYRTGVVLNIMIILVRFFKAFLVQPRLSIVTHTFIKSFVDVIHFMVILACLMFAFVFTGIYLFGHKLAEFSDVGEALMMLYQGMTASPLLKWDPIEVAAEAADGHAMAVTWYVVYMFIVPLVFRSMLLAIIMTAYAEARQSAGPKARTMWAQLADVIIEARALSRGALQLSQVISFLHEPPDHTPLDDAALYMRETVNIHDIINTYNQPEHFKPGTPAQEEYRRRYARNYMLDVVAEYFDFIELKDPSDQENRQREAFQRISELDSDFKDMEKRLQRFGSEMHNGFGRIMDALNELKGEKPPPRSGGVAAAVGAGVRLTPRASPRGGPASGFTPIAEAEEHNGDAIENV